MGAWIETDSINAFGANVVSHPVWVRGLKHNFIIYARVLVASHPVWVRGLKQYVREEFSGNDYVAPRVGAWIET